MNLDHSESNTQPELARLAAFIKAHAPYDGHFNLRLPGVEVIRASRANGELVHGVARPAVCIVAQGGEDGPARQRGLRL